MPSMPSLLAQSACVAGILQDRDSCPKAPTNDTRVMAVGLPAQAREGGPGKNVQGVMHITATAPIRVFMTSVVSIRENPMSDLAARSRKIYLPVPSTSITVVCLFCLLGLVITAAIVPMIPLEDISWVLSHIE